MLTDVGKLDGTTKEAAPGMLEFFLSACANPATTVKNTAKVINIFYSATAASSSLLLPEQVFED